MKKWLVFSVLLTLHQVATAQRPFGKLLKQTPGVVSYTYRNEFTKDVAATLDSIKALGITNIEFSSLFGKTPAQLRALLDARGMRCSSFGTGYNDLKTKADTVAQTAKTLGAEFVRVSWIPHSGPMDLELAQKTVVDFDEFGKKMADKGLTFCYHNHGFEFSPRTDVAGTNETFFDYLVQRTNPQTVFFEMDVVWVQLPGQDPVALLKKYPKRFKLMHLKDLKKGLANNLTGGTPPENSVTFGTGQVDMPSVLKAALKTDIKYLYVEDESPVAFRQVPQSLTYLRGL